MLNLWKFRYSSVLAIWLSMTASCSKQHDKPTEAPPVRVAVTVVGGDSAGEAREYSGTVSSSETTTVSFSVPGTIKALYVSEGQKVSRGQALGKIDDGDLINSDNIAVAELAQARDAYQRLKKLHDANALPEIKWVEIREKLKQAENAAEITKRTLGDATLHSPVSGTISKKIADVGQTVVAVEPVYEIVSTDHLTIDIPVSENEIGSFAIGQPAKILFGSKDVPEVEGKVSSKSIVADPLTRSFTVKVDLPSTGGRVLPGMVGTVIIEKPAADSISNFTLPSRAVLLSEDNRNFVWVVKAGKAERRFVSVDELVADGVRIIAGLQPGDSVVSQGMQKIGTGSVVDIVR